MRDLQEDVHSHEYSKQELAEFWDSLSGEEQGYAFSLGATMEDVQKRHQVVGMELDYMSEICSEETLQGVAAELIKKMKSALRLYQP